MSDFSTELRKLEGKHSVFPVFALVSALISKVVSLGHKYVKLLNLKLSFRANGTITERTRNNNPCKMNNTSVRNNNPSARNNYPCERNTDLSRNQVHI